MQNVFSTGRRGTFLELAIHFLKKKQCTRRAKSQTSQKYFTIKLSSGQFQLRHTNCHTVAVDQIRVGNLGNVDFNRYRQLDFRLAWGPQMRATAVQRKFSGTEITEQVWITSFFFRCKTTGQTEQKLFVSPNI